MGASTGRLGQDGKPLEDGELMDHYRPWSKMFPKKLRLKIAVSTIGVLLSWAAIYHVAREYGALSVWLWYGGPLMWNQAWLVLYTWLQHNDPSVPQYGPDKWTWVKGALSTIDRPFYNADIATAAI